jgi:hypothetical protein
MASKHAPAFTPLTTHDHARSSLSVGSGGHQFGRTRYNQHSLGFTRPPSKPGNKFEPLPHPTGNSPFRLDLEEVIDAKQYADIVAAKHLVFHVAGDTGGIKDPYPQEYVAYAMEQDFYTNPADRSVNPAFFYQLGDCIYFNGEAAQYYSQFYDPYEHYLGPIFAVPGNHDGDAIAPSPSLEAFVRNYCAARPGTHSPDAGDSQRTAMNQPNVYWTLVTPFARILGLYTNVPEGGSIQPDQLEWLEGELADAGQAGGAVIVAMHHPIYSADDHHSGSPAMHSALSAAIAKSGVSPDLVLAGHVHDYQRFTRTNPDNRDSIYVVAGAGGYHNLHKVAKVNGDPVVTPVTLLETGDRVTFEKYNDTENGFLRLELSDTYVVGKYYTVNKHPTPEAQGALFDTFRLDYKGDKSLQ